MILTIVYPDTTNNNPTHGTPLNPYNSNCYTGGSSGGSGYAVGAGIVPLALGADGGGSIRIPSSYCGIYGLKPTHGRISCWPTQSRCPTNGVVGPMAANMIDLEVAYRIMATNIETNAATSAQFPEPARPPTSTSNLGDSDKYNHNKRKRERRRRRKVVLGVYEPWFAQAEPSVQEHCYAAITHLVKTYPEVYTTDHSISIPYLPQGQLAHGATILCEIANSTPDEVCTCLSPAARALVAVGRRAPAKDLMVAQRMRALQMGHLAGLFARCREQSEKSDSPGEIGRKQYIQHSKPTNARMDVNQERTHTSAETTVHHDCNDEEYEDTAAAAPVLLILSPTTPSAGAHITKPDVDLKYGVSDANASFRSMLYTYLANFTGIPALTVPVGYVEPELASEAKPKGGKGSWIPVGMQAMGEWGAEEDLIEWGYDMEEYLHLHWQHQAGDGSESNADGSGKDGIQGTLPAERRGRVMPDVWVDALAQIKNVDVGKIYGEKEGLMSVKRRL